MAAAGWAVGVARVLRALLWTLGRLLRWGSWHLWLLRLWLLRLWLLRLWLGAWYAPSTHLRCLLLLGHYWRRHHHRGLRQHCRTSRWTGRLLWHSTLQGAGLRLWSGHHHHWRGSHHRHGGRGNAGQQTTLWPIAAAVEHWIARTVVALADGSFESKFLLVFLLQFIQLVQFGPCRFDWQQKGLNAGLGGL